MRGEAAVWGQTTSRTNLDAPLRRHAETLQRLLARLAAALGDVIGGLVDARDHLGLVLELAVLGRDDAEDRGLRRRQVLEWLEAASARRVELEAGGQRGGASCVTD